MVKKQKKQQQQQQQQHIKQKQYCNKFNKNFKNGPTSKNSLKR